MLRELSSYPYKKGIADLNTNPQPQETNEKWHWLFSIPWLGIFVLAFGGMFFVMGLNALGCVLGLIDPANQRLNNIATPLLFLIWLPSLCLAGISWVGKRFGFGRDTQPSGNVRFSKVGCGLFCIGILLQVISMAFPAAEAARQAAEDAKDQRWIERSFGEGNFVVTTPESWVIQEDQSGPSGLYLVAARHDLHLIVSAAPRIDVVAKTIGEFRETAIRQVADSLQNSEIIPGTSGTRNSIEFQDTFVSGEIDGIRLKSVLRHFEAGGLFGELRFWSTPSKFDEHAETAKRVLDSLRMMN